MNTKKKQTQKPQPKPSKLRDLPAKKNPKGGGTTGVAPKGPSGPGG